MIDGEPTKQISLKTLDDQAFVISKEVIEQCHTLHEMISHSDASNAEDECCAIPLNSSALQNLLALCHDGPGGQHSLLNSLSPEHLFDVLCASIYLDAADLQPTIGTFIATKWAQAQPGMTTSQEWGFLRDPDKVEQQGGSDAIWVVLQNTKMSTIEALKCESPSWKRLALEMQASPLWNHGDCDCCRESRMFYILTGKWQQIHGDGYFRDLTISTDGSYRMGNRITDGLVRVESDNSFNLKRTVRFANDHRFTIAADGNHINGHCPQSGCRWLLRRIQPIDGASNHESGSSTGGVSSHEPSIPTRTMAERLWARILRGN